MSYNKKELKQIINEENKLVTVRKLEDSRENVEYIKTYCMYNINKTNNRSSKESEVEILFENEVCNSYNNNNISKVTI